MTRTLYGGGNTYRDFGATIPQDWDGSSYCYAFICVPDSDEWRATLSGTLLTLSHGRFWRADGPRKSDDPNAVEIKDVQAIGLAIWESLCMGCNDLIDSLKLNTTLNKYMLALLTANQQVLPDNGYIDPQASYDETTNPNPDPIKLRDTDLGHSVFVTDNWVLPNETITDAVSSVLYDGLISGGLGITLPFSGTGLADVHQTLVDQVTLMPPLLKAQEVALKHINGKLSRSNLVPATLTEDGLVLSGNQSTSVFTYDRLLPGQSNEWLGSILIESLRAGLMPGISIPGIGSIGGRYGVGLADLFKTPEPPIPKLGGILEKRGGQYFFNGTRIWPPNIFNLSPPIEGVSIVDKLTQFFQMQDGDAFKTKADMTNIIQVLSHSFIEGSTGVSWYQHIYEAIDYLKCICLGQADIKDSIDNITIPANTPSTPTDMSGVETGIQDIVNALNLIDASILKNKESVESVLGDIQKAIVEMEIQAIAVSGEGNQINFACCELSDNPLLEYVADIEEALQEDSNTPYIPVLTKSDPCEPINTQYFITFLEYVLGTYDVASDWFVLETISWLIPRMMGMIARLPKVYTAMISLGFCTIVSPGLTPDDPPVLAATAGGAIVLEICLQLLEEAAETGLQLVIDFLRYDYDFFKAWECTEAEFDIFDVELRWYSFVDLNPPGEHEDTIKTLGRSLLKQLPAATKTLY